MMGYMRPTFAQGKKAAISNLLELRSRAQKDKEPRVVLRIQGILMSLMGHTSGEIAEHLKVHRSTGPLWIDQLNQYGKDKTSHTIGSSNVRRIFATRSSVDSITCDIIRRRSKIYSLPFFDFNVELLMRAYIVSHVLVVKRLFTWTISDQNRIE